jgi:hypothetical protein
MEGNNIYAEINKKSEVSSFLAYLYSSKRLGRIYINWFVQTVLVTRYVLGTTQASNLEPVA